MNQQVEALRAARRLYRSEGRTTTLAAVGLVAVFIGWPVYRFYRAQSGGER